MKVGDLVHYRIIDEPDDWDAVGLILDLIGGDAWVQWSDLPNPRWFSVSVLVPVPPIEAGVE
jgi:hypothetical protein